MLRVLQSLLDRQEFLLNHNNAGTGIHSNRRCHVATRLSDVVEQAAVEERLDGADGPDVVLVFPPLDEGYEPGGVQV